MKKDWIEDKITIKTHPTPIAHVPLPPLSPRTCCARNVLHSRHTAITSDNGGIGDRDGRISSGATTATGTYWRTRTGCYALPRIRIASLFFFVS